MDCFAALAMTDTVEFEYTKNNKPLSLAYAECTFEYIRTTNHRHWLTSNVRLSTQEQQTIVIARSVATKQSMRVEIHKMLPHTV
jgi:hypothetical protein